MVFSTTKGTCRRFQVQSLPSPGMARIERCMKPWRAADSVHTTERLAHYKATSCVPSGHLGSDSQWTLLIGTGELSELAFEPKLHRIFMSVMSWGGPGRNSCLDWQPTIPLVELCECQEWWMSWIPTETARRHKAGVWQASKLIIHQQLSWTVRLGRVNVKAPTRG